ncbi:MAG: glycosyltransferase family 87 protein, partial [Candidatus Promineifilaceae bacterium]
GLVVIADQSEVIIRDWRENYRPAVISGDYLGYRNIYNPSYVVLLLGPLALLPLKAGFALLGLMSVVCFRLAAYFSRVSKWLIFPSFPALWVLVYGQLDALVALGVALGWWAIRNKRPYWQGAATLLLVLKPHVGGLLALVYLLWQRDRRALVVSGVFVLATLPFFGLWPIQWLKVLFVEANLSTGGAGQNTAVNEWNNIGLYPYGLLLLPLLLVPYAREQKIPAVISASLLASPYAGAYTLMAVMGVPLPLVIYPILSLPLFTQAGYDLIILAPLALVIYPVILYFWQRRQGAGAAPEKVG